MNGMKKMGCWAALVAVAVLLAGPAVAVPGLIRRPDVTDADSKSPKIAKATCPSTAPQVVGGGAVIDELVAAGVEHQVVLTHLVPLDGATQDAYEVHAEEPAAGVSHSWRLTAYAICADPLAGHVIVPHTTSLDSEPFVPTAAVCPSGKRVIGTGSQINNSGGRVGLQLSRASGPLDISRSTARERAGGYSADWSLTSYAICVNPVNVHAEAELESANSKGISCPDNTQVHSAGGGGALVDTGASFLQTLLVTSELTQILVVMTGPLSDGIVAQAICGP